MKLELIVAPVVALYSPTVPLVTSVTNRWLRLSKAMPIGLVSPWPLMNVGLMVAPVMALYSPTVALPPFATKRTGWAFAGEAARPKHTATDRIAAILL